MEFTLSFNRIDQPDPIFVLTVDADLPPQKLADFDGGRAVIKPDTGYEENYSIRAYVPRDDRVELVGKDSMGKEFVAATVAEGEGIFQSGAKLKVAIGHDVTWTECKILYCSWKKS